MTSVECDKLFAEEGVASLLLLFSIFIILLLSFRRCCCFFFELFVVVALLLALLKFSFVRRPVEAMRGIRITQCVRLSARPPSLCEKKNLAPVLHHMQVCSEVGVCSATRDRCLLTRSTTLLRNGGRRSAVGVQEYDVVCEYRLANLAKVDIHRISVRVLD